jgi:hypothetical protein
VLQYISSKGLIPPFNYGTSKPSSGCDISTPEFLAYVKDKYPSDFDKIRQYAISKTLEVNHSASVGFSYKKWTFIVY